MKIRAGFVSNSSSSSFVVHKSELGEHYNDIVNDLELLSINTDGYWGDSGETYTEQRGYLFVETHRVYSEVKEIFAKRGIDCNNIGLRMFG
jgi:hypothetical protein